MTAVLPSIKTAATNATAAKATATKTTAADPYRLGAIDVAPMMVALLPFALAIGTTAAANGLSLAETLSGAWLILAGAAQLAALGQIGSEAGIAITVTTAAIINLRFVLYGAGASRWFADRPRWQQLLLAIPLVDQNFVAGESRFAEHSDSDWRVRYYLTFTAGLIAAFTAGQVIGYGLGAGVPAALGIHMAGPLVFAGMLAGSLSSRQNRAAGAVAAVVVVIAAGMPASTALPIAIVAGVVAGSNTSEEGDSK